MVLKQTVEPFSDKHWDPELFQTVPEGAVCENAKSEHVSWVEQ